MKDPEAIDDLILRSILGETSRKEEKELRDAFSQDPTLLARRRKLAETARLLAEVHGAPSGAERTKAEAIPFWRQALRSFTPVGSGMAAGLLILFLLLPALDRTSESQLIKPQTPFFTATEQDASSDLAPRGGVASAPPAASPPAPRGGVASAPPSASPPVEIKFLELEDKRENPQPRDPLADLFGFSSSSERSVAATDTDSLSSEFHQRADERSELDRGKVTPMAFGLAAEEIERAPRPTNLPAGQHLDDPFAATPPPPEAAAVLGESYASSGPQVATDPRQNIPLRGDSLLVGTLFADESQVEEQIGSKERSMAKLEKTKDSRRTQKPPSAPPPPPPPPPPPAAPAAKFTDTEQDNFSTFSLNVTDVSFQLAARQLEQGLAPDPASIRQEEFYNAFDYRDPAPAAGEPIRFEVESATLPASHNLKVVRLAVKTAAQGREAGKPAQITLAVDNSGSMQRADRKNTIQAALAKLPKVLGQQDRVNVVTFATNSRVELLQAAPSETARVRAALNTAPEGGTNLEEGLATAYEIAARFYNPAYENRVILLSDGIANLGQTEADQLVHLIETNRNRGIAFDGFGIGWENLNDPLLAELSRNGDGQYAFLNSPEDAGDTFSKALTGALQSVARDVKVQVEWNPDRVQRFRLVGYETHLLKKEDFRNDAIDAAEMSAEETGNAIYLVELKPSGKGPLGTARVRFKMQEKSAEERSWIIPNPPVWPEIESASPRLQLATAAAIFADKLQEPNRFSGVDRPQLLGWTQNAQAFFNNPAEIETLANMIRNATFLQ